MKWGRGLLFVSVLLSEGCYGGGGAGGGALLPSRGQDAVRAVANAHLTHGLFGSRGALGLEHAVTGRGDSAVFSTDLEAKRFFRPAPNFRIYPELSLGLFELGHDRTERLIAGFASPGLGAGAWWQLDSDLALSFDVGGEYRVRPWDTSVPTVLFTVGVLKLSPLFQEGQGFH